MKIYTLQAVDDLISKYIAKGGAIVTAKEGTLGYGTTILQAPGYKVAIVQEHYLNEWSSGHTVRMYANLPAKYSPFIY